MFISRYTVTACNVFPRHQGSGAESVTEVVHRAEVAETMCCLTMVTLVLRNFCFLLFVICLLSLLTHNSPEGGDCDVGIIHKARDSGAVIGRC
jgi:hypothetical protein